LALYVKSASEVARIRAAGRIAAGALTAAGAVLGPGVSLRELERVCDSFVRQHGATPTFLGYKGFPAAVCISVNEEVVHGIPDARKLNDGDVVKIDVGVTKDWYIADMARTFAVGRLSPEVAALVEATEKAFWLGAGQARAGRRVSDIGHAIQSYVESQGYSVVRELCGHGVGMHLHEDPSVPNFGPPGHGARLVPGLTLAIEPMVNAGHFDVETLDNGWTVIARDRRPSAHYENTVLVTEGEPEILTQDV
jgi:methionyl aminopeptidase